MEAFNTRLDNHNKEKDSANYAKKYILCVILALNASQSIQAGLNLRPNTTPYTVQD